MVGRCRRCDCPVVMMSGHGTVETAVEATRLGAFDFVEKPLSLAKLLRTVERALDAKRAARAASRQCRRIAALVAPVGRSRAVTQLRSELARLAAYQRAVAAAGRVGHRSRSAGAIRASIRTRAPRGPFVVVDSRTLREDDAAATLLGVDAVAARAARAGARRHAVPRRHRGSAGVDPAPAQRPARERSLRAHRRRRGGGAGDPHHLLGARPASSNRVLHRGLPARPARAAVGADGARAAAARLRRGRAGTAAALRRPR